MVKPINVRLANEFHKWQRSNLPERFVIQDLDTWVLALSDSSIDYRPLALVELKRSSIPPEEWTPFKADLPNYMALHRLSKRANLPLWVIYFTKDFELLALFEILSVDPHSRDWIKYRKNVLTPQEFKEKFEMLFDSKK
jgi:hypothetical protein